MNRLIGKIEIKNAEMVIPIRLRENTSEKLVFNDICMTKSIPYPQQIKFNKRFL